MCMMRQEALACKGLQVLQDKERQVHVHVQQCCIMTQLVLDCGH